MRVLYANHTGILGGGERALLALIDALPEEIVPLGASPPGELAAALRSRGIPVRKIAGTDLSLGLHPLRTPRGIGALAASAVGIRRGAAATTADVVHANSIRAGLGACAARRLGGPPVVVHVRDCLPEGRLTSFVRRTITSSGALVLANSEYTARSFGGQTRVAYNGVDPARFDPKAQDRDRARRELDLSPETTAIGVVAQISPWKGQDLAIEALARVRERHPAAELLLAGEAAFAGPATRHDNLEFERRLHRLVTKMGQDGRVRFLGRRDDVPELLSALDILLVPSWEEPFGNATLEGMAMALPVLATSVGGSPELISDSADGLLLAPRDPARWVEAILALIEDPGRRKALGTAARLRALEFAPAATAEAAVEAYHAILAYSGSAKA